MDEFTVGGNYRTPIYALNFNYNEELEIYV